MAKGYMRLVVTVAVDLDAMGAEYGEEYDRAKAREHIRSDVREFLVSTPYAEALGDLEVR